MRLGSLRVQCPGVLFLEHLGVQASVNLRLVDAVAVDTVDEEEREHLHAARPQLKLTGQVVLDGTADLRTLNDLLIDVAQRFTQFENFAVLELYELISLGGADVVYDPSVFVVAVLAALSGKDRRRFYGDCLTLLRAVCLTHVDGYLGGRTGADLTDSSFTYAPLRFVSAFTGVNADALYQVAFEASTGVRR